MGQRTWLITVEEKTGFPDWDLGDLRATLNGRGTARFTVISAKEMLPGGYTVAWAQNGKHRTSRFSALESARKFAQMIQPLDDVTGVRIITPGRAQVQ